MRRLRGWLLEGQRAGGVGGGADLGCEPGPVGDILVSQWVYEIEEKEPAPSEIVHLYPQLVGNWVFRESDAHQFSDT